MRQFTKDNWIMLGIVTTLVMVAAFVLYIPQGHKLDDLRAQIQTEKNAIANYSLKAAVVPDMIRQVQDMKSLYKDMDRRLPKQKELGGFLQEISGNLAKERLDNPMIQPGNPSKEDLFHTMPIIMKFQGNYLSLASFLNRIDNMERLTRVQKLLIATDPKGADTKVDCEMQMNIYFTES